MFEADLEGAAVKVLAGAVSASFYGGVVFGLVQIVMGG